MAWTKYQLFSAGLMSVTGSINTLSAKWADNFVAEGCGGSQEHSFKHPFVQAVGMFSGEFSCLAAFYSLKCQGRRQSASSVEPQQPFNTSLFSPPASCDMTGTSIMYVASNMTSASSFQMSRGAVIIFTGSFSVAFSDRRSAPSQWSGISITIAGSVVVGLADLSSKHDSQHKLSEVITGDLLIIMAQIIIAIQMVLEEKFVYKHNIHPLQAVGIEGFFGFVILSSLLVPMFYIPTASFSGNPRGVSEDASDAFCQVGRQPSIASASLGNISSIAFFNFSGISVTKESSATTRMVLDTSRTIVIWAFTLASGWEIFYPLQILGFLILLMGTALYNGSHRPSLAFSSRRWRLPTQEGEQERSLGDSRTPINEAS